MLRIPTPDGVSFVIVTLGIELGQFLISLTVQYRALIVDDLGDC